MEKNMLEEKLDELLLSALGRFAKDLRTRNWYGRENEAVNLFVFSQLLKPNQIIKDPSQIGIEVAVPQVMHDGRRKKDVRKDLVLWAEPGGNCWDRIKQPRNAPLAILEWKVSRGKIPERNSDYDLTWLKAFSREYPEFSGYAISLGIMKDAYCIICTIVRQGKETRTLQISS